jgi:hypothetical protein
MRALLRRRDRRASSSGAPRELASGRELATLAGHTGWVRACAVTPGARDRQHPPELSRDLELAGVDPSRVVALPVLNLGLRRAMTTLGYA